MGTEYDHIDIIGRTHETFDNSTVFIMNTYYHRQEVSTVKYLIKKTKLKDFNEVIDLGSSVGVWYDNYRSMGFKKITGIDISSERANKAKERGYDEVHVCNAYNLPFEDESKGCVISNDVLVHVLQDSDKLKIFKEIKRILRNDGIFIFNIANASGFGFKTDTTLESCRWNTTRTIFELIDKAGLTLHFVNPSYYTVPLICAHPRIASISTKLVFPFTDFLLKKINNLSKARVIYLAVKSSDVK